MADAPISGLPETTTVGNDDLLLLEQNNTAKKIKGSNWKQYFNANVVGVATVTVQPNVAPSATYNQETRIITLALPAADYIQSVAKTSTSGLVDTYTITTKLGYTATFTVTNAKSITSVTLQSGDHSAGTLDTYRINFNDNTHTDFEVYNGSDGEGAPSSATPLTDYSTGSAGDADTYSRSNHRHPLNKASDATGIQMDGTAAVGSADTYALTDHVHPTDTTRQAQITASGMLKGAGGGSVSAATKGTDYGALSFTVILASASWSSLAQTVSNANFITSGYAYIVSPESGSFLNYGTAQICADDVTTTGQMTFHCVEAPSSDLTVNITRMVSA